MTCAKKRVTCTIRTMGGQSFEGSNDCAEPQAECPRAPNAGYEQCWAVCKQYGHAEEMALAAARAAGADTRGAIVVITGHQAICGDCMRLMADAGIARVEFL